MALWDGPEELRDGLVEVLRGLDALEHPRGHDKRDSNVSPSAGHQERVLSRDRLGGERRLDNQRVAQESGNETALAAPQYHAGTPG